MPLRALERPYEPYKALKGLIKPLRALYKALKGPYEPYQALKGLNNKKNPTIPSGSTAF